MIFNIANFAPGTSFNTPIFTYSGTAPTLLTDGDDWELVFTGDCDITFQRIGESADLFLSGAGNPGGSGRGRYTSADNTGAYGGAGGSGGQCKTVYGIPVSAGVLYQVRIGNSGQSSSAFGQSASNSGGIAGGNGAAHGHYDGRVNAGNGAQGNLAFGSSDTLYKPGQRYGASGAGGSAYSTFGGDTALAGTGGNTGGGNGGSSSSGAGGRGSDGAPNTGSGGGGGGARIVNPGYNHEYFTGAGGNGGSGIAILRNARNTE